MDEEVITCYTRGCSNEAKAPFPSMAATYCPTCWDKKSEPYRKYPKKTTELPEDEKRILYIFVALGITGWLYLFADSEVDGLIELGSGCGISIIFVGFIMWLTQSMFWR